MKPQFLDANIERQFLFKVGDYVKICVESDDGTPGERFWVRLISLEGNLLEGIVDNELVCTDTHGIRFGQRLLFERSIVLDVVDGSGEKQ